MKSKEENKAVFLSADLYSRIEQRAKDTNFGSVEDYVTFVLEEVLKEEDDEAVFSEEEEEEVKKRLRDLGYLD